MKTAPEIFLSYNSVDRLAVVAIQRLLQARGFETFLDRENLVPGLPWPQALEQALRSVRAVAVFIGPQLGGWQRRELAFALDRQVSEEKQGCAFPVIPVLLPGADLTPGFLFLNTWIDLRAGLGAAIVTEALDALESATRGVRPAESPDRTAPFCPYRGLRAFREEDAAFFAGREDLSQRLLELTVVGELVAVVGPSGSGKSSVIQAGLLPRLRRQRPPQTVWDAVVFTPGKEPCHRLAAALIPLLESDLSETKRLAEAQALGQALATGQVKLAAVVDRVIEKSNGTGSLLVVADQFEELFTLTSQDERRGFARLLVDALGNAPFTLLVTLRADFYSQAIGLDREISDRFTRAQLNIGALTAVELEKAIKRPAELVGLSFEPGLAERILADVGTEPGYLPLAQFALTELWQRRRGALLLHEAYDDIGGVAGALTRRAEAEFEKFPEERREIARRLFSRLVRVAEPDEASEDTRQRLNLAGADEMTMDVLQALARADVRLLVTSSDEKSGGQTIEIAHEALIRNWQRLRDWVSEDREFLLWRRRLGERVQEWKAHDRDSDFLLRDRPLSEAERWFLARESDLDADEHNYIENGLQARSQERKREQRRRFQWLALLAGVAATVLTFSMVALLEWHQSVVNQRASVARQLATAANSIFQNSPAEIEVGALLAAESTGRLATLDVEDTLRQALFLLPRNVVHGTSGPVRHSYPWAFSSDGEYAVVALEGGTLQVTENGGGIRTIAPSGSVAWLSIGSTYLAAAVQQTAKIFSLSTGAQVMVFQHSHPVSRVTLTRDGRYLLTLSGEPSQEPKAEINFSPRPDMLCYMRVSSISRRVAR